MTAFGPQPLRYDRRMRDLLWKPINYGASKGLTFERKLIFPNGQLSKFLVKGDPKDAGNVAKI